jgi:hypothetical protein
VQLIGGLLRLGRYAGFRVARIRRRSGLNSVPQFDALDAVLRVARLARAGSAALALCAGVRALFNSGALQGQVAAPLCDPVRLGATPSSARSQ